MLERLNSVLEPTRTVTLTERGNEGAEVIRAHSDFRIVATMNPGNDHGKKELSPALANRFTAVWVPAVRDAGELTEIVKGRLRVGDGDVSGMTDALLGFWRYFQSNAALARVGLSVRDLLVSESVCVCVCVCVCVMV